MLKLFKIVFSIALIFIALSIALHFFRPDPWVTYSSSKKQIKYDGAIHFEGYEKLVEVYEGAKTKPTKLLINSGGGNGLAGILIGRFVKEKGLDVHVKRVCISTCANYVFPAGNKKILDSDALVIYHGGMAQANFLEKMLASHQSLVTGASFEDNNKGNEASLLSDSVQEKALSRQYFPDNGACIKPRGDYEAIVESAKSCLRFRQDIEKEFFAMIDVDSQLPYYGQQENYEATYQAYKHIGFVYDLQSLEMMGLSEIMVEGEKWTPSDNYRFKSVYEVTLAKDATPL